MKHQSITVNKKMFAKAVLITLFFIFCGHLITYAQQFGEPYYIVGTKVDKTFYLLGTLDDYMGRHYPKNNPFKRSYVIVLHKNRIGEIRRIEEIVGKKFTKRKERDNCRNCQDFYELKSRALARKVNHFYSFEKRTWKDLMGFHFYTGSLLCDKISIATEQQQLSFIVGLFLTSGELQNEVYKITLFNSSDRFECAKTILMKLGAEITKEEIRQGEIPVGYFLEFKPSQKIKDAIEYDLKRKSELANKTAS